MARSKRNLPKPQVVRAARGMSTKNVFTRKKRMLRFGKVHCFRSRKTEVPCVRVSSTCFAQGQLHKGQVLRRPEGPSHKDLVTFVFQRARLIAKLDAQLVDVYERGGDWST
eukprot:1363989-Pyramimonas_sp.AAC.1